MRVTGHGSRVTGLGKAEWLRRGVLCLCVFLGFFASSAMARTIKIVQASRLELRNVPTPNGEIEEYIIITGNPAVVLVDEDEVEAQRLEYNKTRRKLRVVGPGSFKSKTETVAGKDFDVDLETQGLQGTDVFITTEDIDIVGINCERLPGQLEVENGYFSPCARCGQTTDAYGFRAGNITLYPGDRLIARDVTILLGGVPVFYLPIVVVFLNDPSRQPRFEIVQNATVGTNIELDLPFTISDFGAGFTLLRYFEKRTPNFGFGVDMTLYDLFGGSNRTRFYFMALPPLAGSTAGVQLAYQVSSSGEFPLRVGVDPEDELPPLRYELNINRKDAEITDVNDVRGVGGDNKRTTFSIKLSMESPNYLGTLETRGFIDHRDAPDPTNPNSVTAYNAGLPRTTQVLPEFTFTARGNLLPKLGAFSLTAWGFSLGIVTAPFDPFNTSARRLAGSNGVYVSAGKLSLNWGLGVDFTPWQDARVNGSASFRGQYYSTSNPDPSDPDAFGEYERNIVFGANLNFNQNLFNNAVTFSAAYNYSISEGESPFAFDKVPTRPPNSSLTVTATARPFTWASLGFGQRIEFTRVDNPFDPLSFNATLNPAPINATFASSFDWQTGQPINYTISLSNSVPNGVTFSVATGYQFADRFNPNFVPRWDDLRFNVGYRSPDNGRFSVSLGLTQNLNNGEIRQWNLNSTWIFGEQETPFTLTFNQTLVPPQYTNIAPNPPQEYARVSGGFSLRYQSVSLSFNNNFDFKPFTFSASNPIPPSSFGVDLNGTEPLPWSLQFRTNVDLSSFELFQPTLNGSVGTRSEAQGGSFEFTLSFGLLLPWRSQSDWRFSSARVNFGWDVLPGFSVFGGIQYSRVLNGGIFNDTFTYTPLGFSLAFAQIGSERPNVFFAMYLVGTYTYTDDPNRTSDLPDFTPGGSIPGVTFGNSSSSQDSVLRPVVVLRYDQCCYAFQFVIDSTPKDGVSFSFSVILPFGKQDLITSSPTDGVRFPLLPFIPPIR
jgi:hypothetical protein